MGLHVYQVEVDEPAASPPRPHADVQVLDAVGREKEGAIRIHLRTATPGAAAADRASTASGSEHKLDPMDLKNLRTYTTPTESHLREPAGTGCTSGRIGAAPPGRASSSPARGLPPLAGFARGDLPFCLRDSGGVFVPFIIHIRNYGQTDSKEIVKSSDGLINADNLPSGVSCQRSYT